MTQLREAIVVLLRVNLIRFRLIGRGTALQNLSLGLFDRDFEIALIKHDQRLARGDNLIVVHIHGFHRSGDSRADIVNMRGRVRIIGGFKIARVQPVKKRADQNDSENDRADDQCLFRQPKFFLFALPFIFLVAGFFAACWFVLFRRLTVRVIAAIASRIACCFVAVPHFVASCLDD